MKYIKTFELLGNTRSNKKYKIGDTVYVIGNNEPAEIINTNYDDYYHYHCKFIGRDRKDLPKSAWYHEEHIIRKLEEWEIESIKYNL